MEQFLGTCLQLILLIPGGSDHLILPGLLLLLELIDQVHGRSRHQAGPVLHHPHIEQTGLEQHPAQTAPLGIDPLHLPKRLIEPIPRIDHQRKLQHLQYIGLHLQELLPSEGPRTQPHQITNLWHFIGLLIFCCDEHAGRSQQLQPGSLHVLASQVAVDEVAGEEEGLWEELEFQVDVDEPVQEDHAHVLVEVFLVGEGGGGWGGQQQLLLGHELQVLLEVVRHALGVQVQRRGLGQRRLRSGLTHRAVVPQRGQLRGAGRLLAHSSFWDVLADASVPAAVEASFGILAQELRIEDVGDLFAEQSVPLFFVEDRCLHVKVSVGLIIIFATAIFGIYNQQPQLIDIRRLRNFGELTREGQTETHSDDCLLENLGSYLHFPEIPHLLPEYFQFPSLHSRLRINPAVPRYIHPVYYPTLQQMFSSAFSSFFRFLRPRTLLLPAVLIANTLPRFHMSTQENIRINERLKKKLNQKYHHNTDLSKEITEDFKQNVLLFTGNSNKPLAEEISQILGIHLGDIKVGRFADGEVSIEVKENVRSKNIYIIQSTCPPVNENLVELLLMVSTMRRASAKKINVIIPYYGYARQDRKTAPRVPISAADVARLLETVGVDRVVLVDVHSGQIQGFFGPRVPVDNLEAQMVAMNYFVEQQDLEMKDIVVVSPDAGGVARAKKFLGLMDSVGVKDCSLAMIIKQREGAGKIGSMHLVGSVENKHAIIIDDIIDTAGTLSEASKALKQHGALSVRCFATHGLFSGKAFENISKSDIDKIIITNSIPPLHGEEQLGEKIVRLSVAPILAEAIFRIQTRTSVSSLFNLPK